MLVLVTMHRKKIQKQLLEYQTNLENIVQERTRQLEQKNEELDSFTYSVSHDLRTPLRAINGFASIISQRHRLSLNEEGKRYFDNIVRASNIMAILIEDLLNFSRIGRRSLGINHISLLEVIEEALYTLKEKIQKEDAVVIYPEKDIIVSADKTLLLQILINLLDNALKYHTPEVKPQVKVSWNENNGAVRIQIDDNGIGIKSEYQGKIFDVFQRLHTDSEYPGTGVGLALVKKAAELMNGTIEVDSEEGRGSTFTLELAQHR
jgi:signal transduction histidine kinase